MGTASFQPSPVDAYHATLAYTVPGVGSFSKSIEREPLTQIAIGGNYLGAQVGAYSNCSNTSNNGAYTDNYSLVGLADDDLGHADVQLRERRDVHDLGRRSMQYGQLFDMPNASYVCTGNLSLTTTATVYELKATAQGLEGRLSANRVRRLPGERELLGGAVLAGRLLRESMARESPDFPGVRVQDSACRGTAGRRAPAIHVLANVHRKVYISIHESHNVYSKPPFPMLGAWLGLPQ